MDEGLEREEFLQKLRLAPTFEAMMRDIEKKMQPYIAMGNDEKIMDFIEAMVGFLGRPLIDAMSLVDKGFVSLVRPIGEWAYLPELYEITTSKQIMHLYPNVNFCKCEFFQSKVLGEMSEFTCKHVLAIRFARLLNRTREDKHVSIEEMNKFYRKLLSNSESASDIQDEVDRPIQAECANSPRAPDDKPMEEENELSPVTRITEHNRHSQYGKEDTAEQEWFSTTQDSVDVVKDSLEAIL